MTVDQLINKLKKMPKDVKVYVANDKMYIDGVYEVVSSEVSYFPSNNFVVIGTDYKHIFKNEKEK